MCVCQFQGLPGICAVLTSQISCLPQERNVLIHRELPLGSFHSWCQLLSPVFVNLPGPSSHRSHAVGKVHLLFIPGPSEDQAPDDSGYFLNHFPCLLFMKLLIDHSNTQTPPSTHFPISHLSVHLSVYPSIHSHTCMSACLPLSCHPCISHFSLCLPILPCIHISTPLSMHPFIIYPSVCPSVHSSTCTSMLGNKRTIKGWETGDWHDSGGRFWGNLRKAGNIPVVRIFQTRDLLGGGGWGQAV